MSALDEVARLKSRRRAELAEAEVVAGRTAEAHRVAAVEELAAAVRAALTADGLLWLFGFYSPPDILPANRDHASAQFSVPGHRPIHLHLNRAHVGGWEPVSLTHDDVPRWDATGRNDHGEYLEGCDTVADALIAAEIEGWTPPPPKETLTSEAEHAARQAWAAITQAEHPLPPAIALDQVQEETGGDRDDAVSAIHYAAALWLDTLRPEQPVQGESNSPSLLAATDCSENLRGENYADADNCRRDVEADNRGAQLDYYHGRDFDTISVSAEGTALASRWLFWCASVLTAIALCQQVSAAAHPATATS